MKTLKEFITEVGSQDKTINKRIKAEKDGVLARGSKLMKKLDLKSAARKMGYSEKDKLFKYFKSGYESV